MHLCRILRKECADFNSLCSYISFPKHLPLTLKRFCSHFPRAAAGVWGELDLGFVQEAGGRQDAAGEDPSSERAYDKNSLNTPQTKGHTALGKPCPVFDELRHTASKTFLTTG